MGVAGFLLPSLLGVLKETSRSTGAGSFRLGLAGTYGVALISLSRGPGDVSMEATERSAEMSSRG